jgi:hypothetical protein
MEFCRFLIVMISVAPCRTKLDVIVVVVAHTGGVIKNFLQISEYHLSKERLDSVCL